MDWFERQQALCRAWFDPYLTDEDRKWLRTHLALADERVPDHDISWIRMTKVRG